MQVFHDALAEHTAQGAAAGDVIATFDSVGLLAPRGRFEVEMYLTSMKLLGQVSQQCYVRSVDHQLCSCIVERASCWPAERLNDRAWQKTMPN